jgi:hypothetical protein
MADTVQRAKRNKAFDASPWIGLAVDGTGVGRSQAARCQFCHPVRAGTGQHGYVHRVCLVSVVGTGLSLPIDVEPYAPGDSEYEAGQRILPRAVGAVGRRFADYVVVDAEFATAPFLHVAGALGLRVVARLKANLPELAAAAATRFATQPPTGVFEVAGDRVEVWDAEDFDPWATLAWATVRVLRYRQYKRDGTVVEACWLTDWPTAQVGSRALYGMAKSRWEIENAGFNEGKTWHGLEHIVHHHPGSLLIHWLLVSFALTIERLYRLRYLRRGRHRVLTAIELVRWLRLHVCRHAPADTS